ncbi:major capsid protein [Sigmofec virus UA08Rod_5824]|uniref:Major capsid protein n=1 Tax=Sigmofec virus UA08Rod_5824 TaxID=2929441 RepID=A0A976N190_9VIRU|nr:major capsid protein [Sigmofec virus UA08Rod_5824]
MSRNANGRFSQVPTADVGRSKFDRSCSIKTTFNTGELIPFYVDEVLPGDTFSIDTSKVVRLQTPLTPFMDNIFLDTYYFFVPARLCWEHWINFQGENTDSAWVSPNVYTVPQITAPTGGWQVGTVADYMGIPTGIAGLSVNALPFRAYSLIYNEWFRDENLQDPVNVSLGDATQTGSNGSNPITDTPLGGKPFVAAKLHDYFTSALPAPQKGPDVEIPLLSDSALLPVSTYNSNVPKSTVPLRFSPSAVSSFPSSDKALPLAFTGNGSTSRALNYFTTGFSSGALDPSGSYMPAVPTNLWADTSVLESGVAATINSLRLAFQTQKYFEKLARGGSRYIESIKAMFNVTNPDYRLQRPEYLGGDRVPIVVNQIIQSSESTSQSPQGTVTGQSLTTSRHSDFTKSFTEHGYVIGILVARYHHTYQQGLNKMWSRRDVLDFYFPVFANLGEMPIKNKEIYAQGTDVDDEVFGYQEAWAEYRYRPSFVTGEMRSQFSKSLDVWHLADDYSELPTLSAGWIVEDKTNVDRVLAVTSQVSNQFFADIYIKCIATRPMPVFSIPGLIDHH